MNTILLGMSLPISLPCSLDLETEKTNPNTNLGLAVFPTWLVVIRYAPIEHDKPATIGQDEEQGPVRHSVGTDHGDKSIVRETVEAK